MDLRQTPLHGVCSQQGGRMVPFAGWQMPVQFSGLIEEHQAVRQRVGMFDISHMGVLRLEGTNPKDHLQQLVPSDLHRIGVLSDFVARYRDEKLESVSLIEVDPDHRN